MRLPSPITSLALVLSLSACGGGGGDNPVAPAPPPVAVTPPPPAAPAPLSMEREIDPARTSAGITRNFSPHVVINPDPTVAARNRLFVFLPGTGGVPRNQRLILRTAPGRGYHAIGLTYPNDEAVTQLCAGSTVADCTGLARREVLTGEDTSPLVTVDRANAIITRLAALLNHLHSLYPSEGWGQYLSGGELNWALITVAGHSQGAGHAAYLGKLHILNRVVMFSSPGDTSGGGLAPWLSLPVVTPAARHFGFTHTADGLAPFALVTASWAQLGMAGTVVTVDGAASPFGNAQRLSTSAAPGGSGASGDPAHGAPVVDAATPLDGAGQPLFRPVWVYLAFP